MDSEIYAIIFWRQNHVFPVVGAHGEIMEFSKLQYADGYVEHLEEKNIGTQYRVISLNEEAQRIDCEGVSE